MPADYHEFALIEWIRARTVEHPRVTLGIGDDTASLRFPETADCLVTVDMLMDGIHFNLAETDPGSVGHKALGVSLSDIAAMAGRPIAAVVGVAYPRQQGPDFARALQQGLADLAAEFDVAIAGGDTNTWPGPLVISVTVLGEATGRGAVRRNGARAGDWIMATGGFGGSLGGKHVTFRPRVTEALRLHETVSLNAMIDVSDGLAADLHHLLDESGVGAVISADAVPISEAARANPGERTPLDCALSDGEDFELLFTVSAADGAQLLRESPVEVPLSHIGEIVSAPTCNLEDAQGNRTPLPPTGWVHPF